MIAKFIDLDYSLPPDLVEGLWERVMPNLETWRSMGVFGPEIEVPSDADRETQLLGKTGYWVP